MSPGASSAPNYGGGDGGRSAYSTPSGNEMAPTYTSAKAGAENSLRSSAAKNLSLMRVGLHFEPGGLGCRGGELPAQQRGRQISP